MSFLLFSDTYVQSSSKTQNGTSYISGIVAKFSQDVSIEDSTKASMSAFIGMFLLFYYLHSPE